MPQDLLEQVVQGDFTGAFGVGVAGFQRRDQRVAHTVEMQTEFVLVLHRHHMLTSGNFPRQGPQQGRLSRRGATRDDHVFARAHRGAQEVPHRLIQGPGPHQVVQTDVGEPVPANRHRRAAGDFPDRGQP